MDTMSIYRSRFPAGPQSVVNPATSLPDEDVEAKLAELQRLVQLESDARHNATAARQSAEVAREEDSRVFAAAIRAGRAAPKDGKEAKALEALRAAERRLAALEVASRDAHTELLAAIGERGGQMARDLDERAAQLAREAADLARDAGNRLGERACVLRAKSWVVDPHKQGGTPRSRAHDAISSALGFLEEAASAAPRLQLPDAHTLTRRRNRAVIDETAKLVQTGMPLEEARLQAEATVSAAQRREVERELGRPIPQNVPREGGVYVGVAPDTA